MDCSAGAQFVSKRLHSGKLETLSCCSTLTLDTSAGYIETALEIWILAALSTTLPQLHTLAFKALSTSMQPSYLNWPYVVDGLLSVEQVQQQLQQDAQQVQSVQQQLQEQRQKLEEQGDLLAQIQQQLGPLHPPFMQQWPPAHNPRPQRPALNAIQHQWPWPGEQHPVLQQFPGAQQHPVLQQGQPPRPQPRPQAQMLHAFLQELQRPVLQQFPEAQQHPVLQQGQPPRPQPRPQAQMLHAFLQQLQRPVLQQFPGALQHPVLQQGQPPRPQPRPQAQMLHAFLQQLQRPVLQQFPGALQHPVLQQGQPPRPQLRPQAQVQHALLQQLPGDPQHPLLQQLQFPGALENPQVQQLPPDMQQHLGSAVRRYKLIDSLQRELAHRSRESQRLQSNVERLRSPLSKGRQEAILALLETAGCLAPQLSALRMDGILLQEAKLSLKFRALSHLTIDLWDSDNGLQALHGLISLEVLRVNADRPSLKPQCDLDLPFLTGLKQFIYSGVAPTGLVLPESCECLLVSRGHLAVLPPLQALIPVITAWLVSLEMSLPKPVLNDAVPGLLRLDARLEQLTLECASMGVPESPFVVSLSSCPLIAQAQQTTLICWTAHLQIPAPAELAWSRVRLIGQSQLWVSAEAPEELLSGCAFLQFSFHVSNLMPDGDLIWRSAAEGLGLNISICSQWSHDVLAADSSLSLGDSVATFYRPEEGVPACMQNCDTTATFRKQGRDFPACMQNSFCRCQACRSTLDLHGMLP